MSKVITRISPTGKSAVYMLKRGFYRVMMQLNSLQESLPLWKEFVPKVVEKINKEGLISKPCRIIVSYDEEEKGDKKIVKPKEATVEIYEKIKEIKII